MKTPRFLLSILIASFVLLAQATAQVGTIRVSIANSFTVGQQTMPAGDYRLSIKGSLLQVMRVDGKEAVHVITNLTGGNAGGDMSPRLVFHRYGDTRFLSEVWIGEANTGHQLYATAKEVQLARAIKQEVVILAAVRVPASARESSHSSSNPLFRRQLPVPATPLPHQPPSRLLK